MRSSMFSLVVIILFPISHLIGQISGSEFSDMLQTYYIKKPQNMVNVTIEYVNMESTNYNNLTTSITGFYGALFERDSLIKTSVQNRINEFEREDFQSLFKLLLATNVSNILDTLAMSPSYNDVCWAAFFACGDTNYIDQILINAELSSDLSDMYLCLTGYSAKWSLSSLANLDKNVGDYLNSIKKKSKIAKEVLKKEPSEFKSDMIALIKKQREEGVWK